MGRPKKNMKEQASAGYVPKKIQALPDFEDISTETDGLWSLLLRRLAKLSRTYGFERVEVPLLEDLRLYEYFYKNHPSALKDFPNGHCRPTGGSAGDF